MMGMLMSSIDLSDLVTSFVDFFTILLVTIPSFFIEELLDGGILFDLLTTFFDDPAVMQMLLIFALIGGVYIMARSWSKPNQGKVSVRSKR